MAMADILGSRFDWAATIRGEVLSPWTGVLAFVVLSGALAWWLASRPRAAGVINAVAERVFWNPRAKYFLAAAVFVACSWMSARTFYWRHQILDEAAYLLQARMYAAGMWYMPVVSWETRDFGRDRVNTNFFTSEVEIVRGDRKFVHYSPTYPLLLAAGVLLGAPWLTNAALAAVAVLLAARVAARLYGARAGPAAAWFFAASPALMLKGASYFSESAFLCAYLIFILLFFRAVEGRGAGAALALGVWWGVSFSIRELSTVVGTAPFLAAWFAGAWRERSSRRLLFLPGALIALAPLLAYNAAVMGDPFSFPRFAGTIPHVRVTARILTVIQFKRLWMLNKDALGWPFFSLLPVALVWFWVKRKKAADAIFLWTIPVTIITLIPTNYVGIDYGTRYWLTAAVALVFLAARAFAARAADLGAAGKARALCRLNGTVLILVAAAVASVGVAARNEVTGVNLKTTTRMLWVTPALRDALARVDVHNAVVFIGPPPRGFGPMPNGPRLDDDVIFARDQGQRNRELFGVFAGRRFLRCDYDEFEKTGVLRELPPP